MLAAQLSGSSWYCKPMRTFMIDPAIADATTPPGWFYNDAEVYSAAKERIFARSWQFLGDEGLVRVPWQVHPLLLLEGSLNEPLLLTRDGDDRLHCISNVCTHRANLVCESPGIERTLRCRYHGRRFGLDGRFQSMPEFEGVRDFPSPRDNLPRVALERWGPLLFASLSPVAPFAGVLGPIRDRMAWFPLESLKFDRARSRDYLVAANWALYCENYLEGFHIPYVHAGLNEALDYGAYRTELFDWCSLQLAPSRAAEHVFTLPSGHADSGQRIAAYYWWVFPNLMLNFYPWGLSINVVRPLSASQTRVSFLTYIADESKLEKGAGAGLDRVEREDETIVEAVQHGVRSRLYSHGRYSPTREQGTHHFHQLAARELFG